MLIIGFGGEGENGITGEKPLGAEKRINKFSPNLAPVVQSTDNFINFTSNVSQRFCKCLSLDLLNTCIFMVTWENAKILAQIEVVGAFEHLKPGV